MTGPPEDQRSLEAYRTHLSANYAELLERLGLDVTAPDAYGATVRDARGRSYIDLVAGYGVFNFGHNPRPVLDALTEELRAGPARGGPFLNAPLAELARCLAGLTGGVLSKVFVCSTGAEAVDTALKLARLSTRRREIVGARGAFHGFTLGALSVSGIPAQTRLYEPLLPGVRHVPFGDVDALAAAVSNETAAVILEPIQAEVGAETPPNGYLAAARAICNATGAVLIIDEVRTGMGRTGPLFAMESEGVMPDVVVAGKSLAAGIVPIGAVLAHPRLWGRFGQTFSMSASSFAGNRLAAVAALSTLSLIESSGVLATARAPSDALWEGAEQLQRNHPTVVSRITGRGLLVGIHLTNGMTASHVVRESIRHGTLVATAFCNPRCLLLEPPLVIAAEEVRRAMNVLDAACASAAPGSGLDAGRSVAMRAD
ncbi:MAG: putrescine aminotransferase [Geminicoccaceae bacterium]|jgi:putrescine aminotransferase|nr:putrescine aminotransferase [Geminicoccaceae bacterium]